MSEHYFPTVCVDNFLSNAEEVLKIANTLEYRKSALGVWPGERTESLHIHSPAIFASILSDVFSLFYNYESEPIKWTAEMYFQKTKPYGNFSSGWIHNDLPNLFAGIIYLNKNGDSSSGTSMYSCIDEFKYSKYTMNMKRELYLNGEVDEKKYLEEKENYEKNFIKTTSFSNVFNRMVAYDAQSYHCADGFDGGDDKERLTLVFFINELDAHTVPLKRNK